MAAPHPPLLPPECHTLSSCDPAIKIFGKTIPLPPAANDSISQSYEEHSKKLVPFSSDSSCGSDDNDLETPPNEKLDFPVPPNEAGRGGENNDKKPEVDPEEKTLRKPDKPVPCPRCDSMDTKFCYFNNYNINQPRHFCRNCQRYWTAGGTLRNVPVGAGRRKNKHASQHKRLLADGVFIRDDLEDAQSFFAIPQAQATKSPVMHLSPIQAALLSNTSPTSSCISSVREETSFQGDMARFGGSFAAERTCRHDEADVEAFCRGDRLKTSQEADGTLMGKEECGSSITSSGSEMGSDANVESGNLARPSIGMDCDGRYSSAAFPFFNMPWPYMCMSWAAQAAVPSGTSIWPHGVTIGPNASAWDGPPQGFWQWPSLPGTVWCPPGWNVPPWSLAWGASAAASNSTSTTNAVPGAKRRHICSEGTGDGSLCIPKTLRIHDPEEAACSSILTTLGVDGKSSFLTSGGVFNAFQPKAEVFQRKSGSKLCEERPVNPAAMSRSMAFQESNKGL